MLILSHLDVHLFGILHDSYQKRFLHGIECTLSFVKLFASFPCEKARAWLFQLPLSFFMRLCERFTNLDALDFRDLYRFLSKHKFSSPCAYVVAISWFDASQVHKLMRTRTYVNLHFRCLFSCRQVGSIYLMQGEFAESVFFLIPRSWSGAWPNFVYVDNFWKRRKWNGQSLILAYYYAYQHKIIS